MRSAEICKQPCLDQLKSLSSSFLITGAWILTRVPVMLFSIEQAGRKALIAMEFFMLFFLKAEVWEDNS
jgi:hypothetical protein